MPIEYRAYLLELLIRNRRFSTVWTLSNGRINLKRNMTQGKNVVAYEQIFCTIAGDGTFSERSSPSRSRWTGV